PGPEPAGAEPPSGAAAGRQSDFYALRGALPVLQRAPRGARRRGHPRPGRNGLSSPDPRSRRGRVVAVGAHNRKRSGGFARAYRGALAWFTLGMAIRARTGGCCPGQGEVIPAPLVHTGVGEGPGAARAMNDITRVLSA